MVSAAPAQRHRTLTQVLFPQQTMIRHAALIVAASLLIALSAQVSIRIPIGPVPITGQTFAWLLVGGLLGPRLGAAAILLYLAEGALGLPFFAAGKSGWQVLSFAEATGSTSGYLIGAIPAAALVGWLAERGWDRRPLRMATALFLGNLVIYAFGLAMLWVWAVGHTSLLKVDHVPFSLVLKFGLLPFIPGDLAKLLLAAGLVPSGWQLLRALGFRGADTAHAAPTALHLAPLAAAAGLVLAAAALLPWSAGVTGIQQSGGMLVLAAGVIGAAAALLRMRGLLSAGLTQLLGFAAGAAGGLLAFVHLVAFTKAGEMSLADVSIGVPVAVLAALVLLGATAAEASTD